MSHDVYNAEPYAVTSEETRVAGKTHRCDACHEPITRGHAYVRFFGVWDGYAEAVKRCLRCQKIFEHLVERGREADTYPAQRLDCGYTYGEEWGEDPPEHIAALAFALPGEVTS